jgi:anti-anti-sigma factor
MSLDIQSAVDASTVRIALAGELDSNTAPALREVVDRVLGGKPAQLVLQVEQLSFMASAGLRILIFAKQKQPGLRIYFVKPMPAIVDTLRKTGFYDGVYVTDVEPAPATR